jgi:putative phosphoesterase
VKIGFLADTHSMKNDGSDLPDAVLEAFKGCDRIVHLGDIGKKKILDRLAEVAPVWVQSEDRNGYVPLAGGATVKAFEGCGLTFNLAHPDKKITVGDTITFADAMDKLLLKRFKEDVSVVAFAATHAPYNAVHDGVLFVNPGSPTLPMTAPGTVAILTTGVRPKAKLVSI